MKKESKRDKKRIRKAIRKRSRKSGRANKKKATSDKRKRQKRVKRIQRLPSRRKSKAKTVKPKVKSPRSFNRKVYKQLPKKDNDRLRRLARDLAAAKAEVARLKKQKTRPKKRKPKPLPKQPTALEKAKRLKVNVKYLPNKNHKVEVLNSKLAELNSEKIMITLSDSPDKLRRLAELEQEAITYRKQRYRLTRPYFSEKLIEFREGHVNGVDSFIHACKSIGMSEREAYTLWYSPK